MIRKNSLLCKLIRIKTSSKFLFDTFMAQFRPELETCPICNSTGNCHIHDYYRRSIIDFDAGQRTHSGLCVLRVFCDSCEHAHAVLPDAIIPYSSFSLLFVLRLLGQCFADLGSVEQLWERFGASPNLFYKWLKLWNFHKQRWLGVLADSETSSISFWKKLYEQERYSDFSMEFIRSTSYTFLQAHKNPVLQSSKNAHYCQTVFAPDIFIF